MKYLVYLLVFFSFISCEKLSNSDCEDLKSAFINEHFMELDQILSPILEEYTSEPINNDNLGHKENLLHFVDLLTEKCSDLALNLPCYACIYTLPPKSKITVNIQPNHQKTLSISTPEGGKLKLLSIH